MNTSILTYKITKKLSTKRDAMTAGLILTGWTGQKDTAFTVERRSAREWTLRIFVRDVDLEGPMADAIQHILDYGGTSYGTETFTS